MIICPHCGKEIYEPKPINLALIRIRGRAQEIEKTEHLGQPYRYENGFTYFVKTSGPQIIYVKDKVTNK